MTKISLLLLLLSIPLFVLIIKILLPNNKITSYLIPKILRDEKHSKSILRKVGVAYLLLGFWLISIIFVLHSFTVGSNNDSAIWIVDLFTATIPFISALSCVIGFYYLMIGIFSRSDYVRPKLESMDYVEEAELNNYIRKLKTYTIINLSSLFLLICLILMEVLLGIETSGKIVLINITLLVTTIMTFWRIRAYIVKSAKVMNLPANKYFFSTLFHPLGLVFVWVHAINLIKKYRHYKR